MYQYEAKKLAMIIVIIILEETIQKKEFVIGLMKLREEAQVKFYYQA